jgi:adenylate cyclase
MGGQTARGDCEVKILGQTERAIVLAPNSELPYYAKSFYLFLSRRANEALGTADAGLAINPNSALLNGMPALAENSLGHFEQAKSDITKAMRLSPHDPFMLFWPMYLGDAELDLGHFEVAVEEYQKSIDNGFHKAAPTRSSQERRRSCSRIA